MAMREYFVVRLNDNLYDDDVRTQVAGLFDVAVNSFGLRGQLVADLFVSSGLAESFERQNPRYVAGKSPAELACLIAQSGGIDIPASVVLESSVDLLSPDYWLGDMLALFQLRSGWFYSRIFEQKSYADLREMYYWCRDLSEDEYIAELRAELAASAQPSRLQTLRRNLGLTQGELAAKAGVSTRAIQQYEQGAKSINKAAAETVYCLSRVLHVRMEDLLEMPEQPDLPAANPTAAHQR